jgi:hypothetical protein
MQLLCKVDEICWLEMRVRCFAYLDVGRRWTVGHRYLCPSRNSAAST